MASDRSRRIVKPSSKQRQLDQAKADAVAAKEAQAAPRRPAPKPPAGTQGGFTSRSIALRPTPTGSRGNGITPAKAGAGLTLNETLRRNAMASPAPLPRPRPILPLPGRAVPSNLNVVVPAAVGLIRSAAFNEEDDDDDDELAPAPRRRLGNRRVQSDDDEEEDEHFPHPRQDAAQQDDDQLNEDAEGHGAGAGYFDGHQDDFDGHQDAFNGDGAEDELDAAQVQGRKRARSLSTEAVHSVGQPPMALRNSGQQSGRARQSDFADEIRAIIEKAVEVYATLLVTVHAFPDRGTEVDWAHEAWDAGCEACEVFFRITPEIVKLLLREGSHLRGAIKTKARPIVQHTYGFKSSHKKSAVTSNRRRSEVLSDGKPALFVYRMKYETVVDDHNIVTRPQDLYKTPCAQELINICFFANRRAIGAVYPEYFTEKTVAPLALVLTVIKHCIDEWANGSRATDCHFTERDYAEVYSTYLADLKEFKEISKEQGVLDKILRKLIDNGREHAGVESLDNLDTAGRVPRAVYEEVVRAYNAGDMADTSSDDEY
ncbi:hypothetical protein EIP91_011411 [Steccherinum ochraceum]|uniref:DUF6532 domain-containing protein n=1 Tax=Steccherinum ochraceum TaxID=92696 RepID=A0A4R0RBE1_9APHY|nr:hypothetical protein EIP91_011411 [Steccherinum ochraceum]